MAFHGVGSGIIPTGNASNFTAAAITFSNTGDNIVIAGTANQTIRVFRIFFVTSAATNITIKNGAGTSLTGAMAMGANGGFTLDFQNEAWFITSAGNDFIINQSGTAQVSGTIYSQKS